MGKTPLNEQGEVERLQCEGKSREKRIGGCRGWRRVWDDMRHNQ